MRWRRRICQYGLNIMRYWQQSQKFWIIIDWDCAGITTENIIQGLVEASFAL